MTSFIFSYVNAIFKNPLLIACSIWALILNLTIDFFFYNLKTIQGHIFVALLEVYLQVVIYIIGSSTSTKNLRPSNTYQFIVIFSLANLILVTFKAIFILNLASTPVINDFGSYLSFAPGKAYALSSVADGKIDAIANILYQCRLCGSGSMIPLNEPFIAYFFVAISFIAGEFNQHILWLTLTSINLLTANTILRIVQVFYPSIQNVWVAPLGYILFVEVNAINLYLFKDGIIALLLLYLFYTYLRYVTKSKTTILTEIFAISLIILLLSFRSGMLFFIVALTFISCIFSPKYWILFIRIFFLAVFGFFVLSKSFDHRNNIFEKTIHRSVNVALEPKSKYLDHTGFQYSSSQNRSIPERLNIHNLTFSNLLYAPIVKSFLYFLLPLNVFAYTNQSDLFHKLSSAIYFVLYPLLALGFISILKRPERKDFYLLSFFCMIAVLISLSGPFFVPRYRIIALPFFVIILSLGISRYSKSIITLSITISTILLLIIIINYKKIYNLLI